MSAVTTIQIFCQREREHSAWFHILLSNGVIQKVGQFPSLADIADDEARNYCKILGQHDSREFSRAIRLAAHGVGIGSFVYLRRIFERLIVSRFSQFKEIEGCHTRASAEILIYQSSPAEDFTERRSH